MRKFVTFLFILIILHWFVDNPTNDLLFSAQFLVQGSIFTGEYHWLLSNMLFNTGMFVLFIGTIFSRLSEIFNLRIYVITRGGESVFKRVLIKKALWEIGKILCAKILIYILFFIIEQRVSRFAVYDLVSTFLTLSMFSLVFILCQLRGANNKLPLFVLIAGNMLAQILSFDIRALSIFVIASVYWQEMPFLIIGIKILILLLLMMLIFFKKNVDQMLEVKNQ